MTQSGEGGHTPGPWAYRPHEFDDWGMVRGPQGEPITQASLNCRHWSDEDLAAHRREGTDPVEANARLISSAPDLLEVARMIVKAADVAHGSVLSNGPLVTAARAALTKATGSRGLEGQS